MVILILILALVAFLAAGLLAAFMILVLAIHDDERHMSLTRAPRNRASAASRRLLASVPLSGHDDICTTGKER